MSRLRKLHHLLIGALIALVFIVPLGVFAFVKSGLYDVAASRPHTKFTEWLTHETMIHSVRSHAGASAAASGFSAPEIVSGFCLYETHCVACHGAAAVAREQWVNGLEPQPPYLLDVTEKFTPAQLFWIVKNGIKMTGMPSWRDSLGDAQVWDIVRWLEASRRLPPQIYVSWRTQRRCLPSLSREGLGVGGGRAGSMPALEFLQPHRAASVASYPWPLP